MHFSRQRQRDARRNPAVFIHEGSRFMAAALDAAVVQQNYSRLVIDCNRMPGSETSTSASLRRSRETWA
jgi:predicted N-formylglutamate amidohydrolase